MRLWRLLQYAISVTWILLLLVGCGAFGATPTSIPPTRTPLPPLPTLEPAGEFVSGMSEIPEGEYLFLDWWRSRYKESLEEPGCGIGIQVYYDGPYLLPCSCPESTPVGIGAFRIGRDDSGDGDSGSDTEVHSIDSLPYTTTTDLGDVVIHAVDADGAIVAEIGAEIFAIEPGQSWMYRVEDESDPVCYTLTTYSLTNHGWMDDCEYDCQ